MSFGSFCAAGAPASQGPLLRLEKSADAMGSTYTVDLYGADRIQMEAAADAAFDEVRRLDELLSNYRPDSEWSQVNRRAAQEPMKVSPELFRHSGGLRRVQPAERRGVRHLGRPVDEGLGILQRDLDICPTAPRCRRP